MKTNQLIAGLMILALAACHSDDNPPPSHQEYYGAPAMLGNGEVRSFVLTDSKGEPTTIGVRLTKNALNGLPDDMGGMHDMMVPVPLPQQFKVAGIDHIELNWNPHGHDPAPVYGAPHFDVHFYMVSTTEQAAVIPGPDTFTIAKEFAPKDYISGVVAVPNMGVHWVDSSAAEFHGQPFTQTFIYGFYHGKMTFLEPMVTKAYLETRPNYSGPVKQPAAFQKNGYYPTIQQIQYDSTRHEYVIAMAGLVRH